MASLGNKNVRWLDVPMNDALGVRGLQRIRDLNGDMEETIEFHRLAGDDVLQRCAVQEFHGDERAPGVFANIVNRADVGMIQRRGRLRLTFEPRQHLRVFGDLVRQEFQRHKAVQTGILRLVDHTHSPAAQFLHDAVMRNGMTNEFRGCHWPEMVGRHDGNVNDPAG